MLKEEEEEGEENEEDTREDKVRNKEDHCGGKWRR